MLISAVAAVVFLWSIPAHAWSAWSKIFLQNCWSQFSLQKTYLPRNWKLPEERKSTDCFSLSEVTCLDISCKAVFYASVGEMFLPFTLNALDEFEKERMFVSRRLYKTGDYSLVQDLICTGCQLCGCPLDLERGYNAYISIIFHQRSTWKMNGSW